MGKSIRKRQAHDINPRKGKHMKIRSKVFETNSSSTHSLSIDDKAELVKQPFSDEETKNGVVTIDQGEFGWEQETYHGVKDKLSYLYTSAGKDEGKRFLIKQAVKDFSGLDVVFGLDDGYIDHQSSDVCDDVWSGGIPSVIRFLFSPKSFFETDNDNH